MKIIDRVRTAFKAFSSPELSNSITAQVARNYSKGQRFAPTEQLRGITYKAIDKIGRSLSIYEPRVSKANGDVYQSHPLYNIFQNPNPIQRSSSDFIHMYGMLTEIYGETFWYMARGEDTKKIKEIYLLNPPQMELKMYEGEVVGYILHKNNGQQVPFDLEEIYHDKLPNPFNPLRGMSVMERASNYVDIELTTTSFTLNYMRNNASPSGIVSLPDMDRDAFRMFTAQWREGYEGPENAGKTAFIRGGEANFKAVGATLHDVDQEITRRMAKDDVLMMFEVPKPLLGGTDDKGFGRGNVEALMYIYMSEKIDPIMKRLDRIYVDINRRQPNTPGLSKGADIVTHVSPVPEDKEFVHQQNKDLVNVAMTVNEVRDRMGLPPISGGDVLDTSNPVVQNPQAGKDGGKVKVSLKKALTTAEKAKVKHNEQEKFRKQVEDTNTLYATKVKTKMSKFAAKQESEVIERINVSTKSYEEWLFDVKEESVKLAGEVTPIILDLMAAQTEDTAHFITGDLLTITDQVRKTAEAQILQIAGVFNTDTIQALEQTLSQGQAAGESLAKLKNRVETVYSDAKGFRAERIARTESSRAGNRSVELTYGDNGFTEVEWFINPGACEFCKTYKGRTKMIGAKFNNLGDVITSEDGNKLRLEYSDLDAPPLHPNCTCSLVPTGNRLGD